MRSLIHSTWLSTTCIYKTIKSTVITSQGSFRTRKFTFVATFRQLIFDLLKTMLSDENWQNMFQNWKSYNLAV